MILDQMPCNKRLELIDKSDIFWFYGDLDRQLQPYYFSLVIVMR